MRRLPIFLVIDISESMAGAPIRQMQEGITRLLNNLRSDPYALETVYLSVIAFAGVARTIAPLVDLFSFYAPRLPMGAGTSLGAALNQVMDEIDKSIVRSTPSQKGDYKPVVYILSDGKATDNPNTAIQRWQRDFAKRATLISIGIGAFADLSLLATISQHTLRYEQLKDDDFTEFIRFISDSIVSQSRSLGVDVPLNVEKDKTPMLSLVKNVQEATAIDENYVIINGLCKKNNLPYLLKYERLADLDIPYFKQQSPQLYRFVGAYALEQDYLDWSDTRVNANTVSTSMLVGGGGCPHCGAMCGLSKCGHCGQIFCTDVGETMVVCPHCRVQLQMMGDGEGNDFDISRSRG